VILSESTTRSDIVRITILSPLALLVASPPLFPSMLHGVQSPLNIVHSFLPASGALAEPFPNHFFPVADPHLRLVGNLEGRPFWPFPAFVRSLCFDFLGISVS